MRDSTRPQALLRKPHRIALAAATGIFIQLCLLLPTSPGRDGPNDKRRHIILWVQEVNRRPMYWINDKPVGREPLTGLEILLGPSEPPENVDLKVILDSRVPIQEIDDIDRTLDKIPITDARYYVYRADAPSGMSEIVWKPEDLPLPQSPPPAGKHPR